MPTRALVLLFLMATLLALALWPSSAGAGIYDVYSCRLPDGRPAATTGWYAIGQIQLDSCPTGGALSADLPVSLTRFETLSGWRFVAPADTTIANFTIHRYAESEAADGYARDFFAYYDEASPRGLTAANPDYCFSHFASCIGAGTVDPPFAPANRVERTGLRIRTLTYQAMCWSVGGQVDGFCGTRIRTPGRVRIFASRFGLADEHAPTFVGAVEGVPRLQESVRGPIDVNFQASDRGGGVARAWVEVDGARRDERPADPSDASCATPYTEVVPCPLSVAGTARLDPHTLGEGVHRVRIGIADAAGNETLSEEFTVSLAYLANGQGASRTIRLVSWLGRRSRTKTQTVRYGAAPTMRGALTNDRNEPIAGAALDVAERVTGTAAWRPVARTQTDGAGTFAYRVAPGTSRVIRVTYVPFSDGQPAGYAEVKVRVRAGVTLRTSKRRVTNGSVLRFSGRVRGERGARRALVTIYALSGGARKRIPVETVRARSDGRFSYTYRFARIAAPSVYRFEARVPRQTGFPYLEGASRSVTVRGWP